MRMSGTLEYRVKCAGMQWIGHGIMDYLKFSCHDMVAQNTDLYSAYGRLRDITEELSGVLNTLDPQIKNYEGLQNQLAATGEAANGAVLRIFAAHTALDQIVDLYYAAENRALQASEELPVGIPQESVDSNLTASSTIKVATATIKSDDLVLEDWLAVLAFRYGKE